MESDLKPDAPGYQERYSEIFSVIQDWGMAQGIEMSPATASSLCHRLVRESLSRSPAAQNEEAVLGEIKRLKPALLALSAYEQADEDGIMVTVSHQAVAEILAALSKRAG
jgi:hypothetical protein